MTRFGIAITLVGCLTSGGFAASLDGTIIGVSKSGFVLQTAKGPKTLKFADHLLKGKTSRRGKGFDMTYRTKPADLKEGMEVKVEFRTVDTDWICEGMRPHAGRIDFGPLAKTADKYTLQVTLVAVDGTKFDKKYEIEAGTSVEAVRDLVQRSLQPLPPPKERWAVSPIHARYLEIDGFIKDDKFSPIEKVEVNCPGLKGGAVPLVEQRWKPPSK